MQLVIVIRLDADSNGTWVAEIVNQSLGVSKEIAASVDRDVVDSAAREWSGVLAIPVTEQ
jgi:hypothetical protein